MSQTAENAPINIVIDFEIETWYRDLLNVGIDKREVMCILKNAVGDVFSATTGAPAGLANDYIMRHHAIFKAILVGVEQRKLTHGEALEAVKKYAFHIE